MTPKELDAICKVLRKNGVSTYSGQSSDGSPIALSFYEAPARSAPRQRQVIDPTELDGGDPAAEHGDEEEIDPTVPVS